ncbi:MAG: hypothetical protein QNJ97_16375 [Myxococcota bacterium]|nr:hypothetical protein [Myxococcota bacterium]
MRIADIQWGMLVFFTLLAAATFNQVGCDGDDAVDADADSDAATDSESSDSDTHADNCDTIVWNDPENYLVNGGTVARWQQTAWVDQNDNGVLDPDEHTDVDIDLLALCKSDKESLVLLLGTDN